MAYVEGEKGLFIQELMDKSNDEFDKGNFERSVCLLEQAWEELPNVKVTYDESFLIVWGILGISIMLKDSERMKEWVDKIFVADPERGDNGERDLWAGKVAYELGDLSKAREYFEVANKKSRGRCFGTKDGKYLKFYKTK
jgi:tetratricopeptide (TPR) repeat protein